MTLAEFEQTLTRQTAPGGLDPALAALWWAAKGEWDRAHRLVMDERGTDCAWVHASLHRVENDLENAGYWYRKAGRPMPTDAYPAEWVTIAAAMLAK